jgi:FkbM family methyltransferase
MKALLETLAGDGTRTWGTVLWAGVGHGSDLPTVRRIAAGRKILLEPHPALFSRLATRTSPAADERLLQVALWSGTGSRELHMVSNPVKSSLLRPTGLLARLPNLQSTGATPVWAMDLENLATEMGIAGSDNLLILDIAGAEAAVLAAAPRALLGRFAAILVAGAEAGDYDGAAPIAEIVDALRALGFEASDRGAHGEVLLERDAVLWELRSEQAALQAQVGDLARQAQEGAARAAALEQALAADRARADEAQAGWEAEVALRTAAETARTQDLAQWAQERDGLQARIAAAEAMRDQLASALAGAESQRDEQSAALAALKESGVQRQGELEALAAERDRLAADHERIAAESAARAAELQSSAEQVARLQAALAERDEQVVSLRQAVDQAMAALATLQENTVQRQGQLEALAGERERLAAELQAAQSALAERDGQLASLQPQVEKLTGEVKFLSEHASDIGRHRDSIAASESALRTQLAEAEVSRDQALQRAQAHEQQAGAANAELHKLRTELAAASRAAALGTKLQMLREADLRDLQQRYEASQEVQARQHDMLMKLGERLSLASNYFHQLAASPGREEGGAEAGAVVEPEEAIEVVVPAGIEPAAVKPRARRAPAKPPTRSSKADARKPASRPAPASNKPAKKPVATSSAGKPAAKTVKAPAASKPAAKAGTTGSARKPVIKTSARKPAPNGGRRKA